ARDPDRFEAMDALFQEFLKEAGLSVDQGESPGQEAEGHKALLAEAVHLKGEIGGLEEEREVLPKKLEKGDGLFNKLLNAGDPAETRIALNDVEKRLNVLLQRLDEFAPQLDMAKQQVDFITKDYQGRL